MNTLRNYNIDGKSRRRSFGSDLDLSFNGDRDILRTSDAPADAGNVGGGTVKQFMENYFFNDTPAWSSATIAISSPIATPTGNGMDAILINTRCYIESGAEYDIAFQITINPNSETDIENRRVFNGDDVMLQDFDPFNDYSHTIHDFGGEDQSWKATMLVGNQGSPITRSTPNIYAKTIPAIIYGVSQLTSLSDTYPYDNGFTKIFQYLNNGSKIEIEWESEEGYHYLVVPSSFPPLQSVTAAGFNANGTWNNCQVMQTVNLTDNTNDNLVTNSFNVYRSDYQANNFGFPMFYEFQF